MQRISWWWGGLLFSTCLIGLPWMLPQATGQHKLIAADDAAPKAPAAAPNDLGWIGVRFDAGDRGELVVRDVFPGGPAAFAGVKTGDVVIDVDGQKVTSAEQAAKAIEALTPGRSAVIRVQRGEKLLRLTVTAGSLREFHARYVGEMLRRDPRHPRYAENPGVSAADQQVELMRRLFEQNQRLEYSIHSLRNEVQDLRKELEAKR